MPTITTKLCHHGMIPTMCATCKRQETEALATPSCSPVGKAFRQEDGIVRWVTHKSKRGYLHLLWYSEENDVWYDGGRVLEKDFERGEEVPAPKETYRRGVPTGTIREINLKENAQSLPPADITEKR